jgi:signal transduction histidine kinase
MKTLNTSHALRAAGLAVWLVVTCTHFAGLKLPADASRQDAARFYGVEGVVALLLAVFAVCLWINLRDAPLERPLRGHVLRLWAQAAAGLLIHTDLMYVVAGQAALVLERRAALRWLAGQTVVLVVWAVLLWTMGDFETLPALQSAPPAMAFGATLLSLLTWQTFAFCAGWLAANEARHRRDFARVNAELQLAQQALADASRLEERLHISRELHDSLGHHLVALSLQLDLAERVAEPGRAAHVKAAANLSRGMLGEVRHVVSALREEAPVDLQAALLALQASVPEPRIHLAVSADLAGLTRSQGHALLRCVQEGTNNTLRHAKAANLWVELRLRNDAVALTIRDDGAGNSAPVDGNGLIGMRERVEAAGGTIALHSAAGAGFCIEVRLPLEAAA